jgi:hypothetical protein
MRRVLKVSSPSMQPISPSEAAASLSTILLVLIGAQVVTIVVYWLTSLLVARERATLKNALRTWIQMILSFVAVGAMAGLGYFAAIHFGADQVIPGIIVICAAVSLLIVAFAVPMHVYDLGFGGAFMFFIINIVFNAAASFAAERWIPNLQDHPALKSVLKRNQPQAATPDPTRTVASLLARREELARRAQQLAIRKQYMAKNDSSALDQYERDKAAYDRDLAQLKADEAAAAAVK